MKNDCQPAIMRNIWIFHLLNDFSGSPLVLRNSILSLKTKANITVCTSDTSGFLSGIEGVNYVNLNYVWNANKMITLLNFAKVQWQLFWCIIFNRNQIDIIYVNTLLPFGAALAGKICSKKVIYHLHEPQVSPKVLFRFLIFVCKTTSANVIFVSKFMRDRFANLNRKGKVVYNVLSEKFIRLVSLQNQGNRHTVLMLCSFKEYKGVYDFVELARLNPQLKFELVLNSDLNAIRPIIDLSNDLENITVYPSSTDVHQFYNKAKVVLNLSHPDQWVESFGMTILEAMAYGLPCIVPEVGGVTELVSEDTGYRISFENKMKISEALIRLFEDDKHYQSLSQAAFERSKVFDYSNFKNDIQNVFF